MKTNRIRYTFLLGDMYTRKQRKDDGTSGSCALKASPAGRCNTSPHWLASRFSSMGESGVSPTKQIAPCTWSACFSNSTSSAVAFLTDLPRLILMHIWRAMPIAIAAVTLGACSGILRATEFCSICTSSILRDIRRVSEYDRIGTGFAVLWMRRDWTRNRSLGVLK